MSRPPPPSAWTQTQLLFGLRIRSGLNRRGGALVSAAAYVVTALPAVGLCAFFFGLERIPALAHSTWSLFVLTLSAFVTTCLFATWPLLSAGVDDHGELSRFASFPVSTRRLVWTSVIGTLLEPRALVLASPVAGAAAGFASVHVPATFFGALVFAAGLTGYLVLNGAWSRAVAHAAINVLKDQRSAELIGSGFLLFLLLASQIPPVDTRWLTEASGTVLDRLGPDVISNAALALTWVPSGFFAGALLWSRVPVLALGLVAAEWAVAWAGVFVAHALLLRFYRRTRGQGTKVSRSAQDPFGSATSLSSALFRRELLDLWRNPRARLLATVPFVLAILLKLLSARSLSLHMLGPRGDLTLLATLSLYGALVMTSTFAQNAFGYDGRALRALIASPVPLADVLEMKNRVHALAGAGLATLTLLYARLYLGFGTARELTLVLLAVACLLPVLLVSGNLLSLFFPVRFHESLERRDRLPLVAVSLGMAAAGAGVLPLFAAVRELGVSGSAALALLLSAAALWALYVASLPRTHALLARRQERVLAAIDRESP